jgi:hypothetical protein
MPERFDPYLNWLGIRDPERPPNHYRLLGVDLFESDPDILLHAADRQMAHVRSFQTGPRSAESQRLLNELASAKVCLLNAEKKAAYDEMLRARLYGGGGAGRPSPPPVPPGGAGESQPPPVPWAAAPTPARPAEPSWEAGLPAERPADGIWDEEAAVPTARRRSPLLSGLIALLVVLALVLAGTTIGLRLGLIPWEPGDETAAVGDGRDFAPDSDDPSQIGEPADPDRRQPGPDDEPPDTPDAPGEPSPAPANVPEALAAVRKAMQARDLAAASSAIDAAEQIADPASRPEVAHVREVLDHLDKFWAAYRTGRTGLSTGDRFQIDERPIVVVTVAGEDLTLTGVEEQYRYRDRDVPLALALAIAQAALDEEPQAAPLRKAAAAIVEPSGDRAQAAEWLREAADLGLPINALAAELRRVAGEMAAVEPPSAPLETPGEPPGDEPAAQPPATADSRRDVPPPAEQAEALRIIRELFADEYAGAKKAPEQRKLADLLYRKGLETRDDLTARYMLLCEARDMAAESGDPVLLRRSLAALGREYRVEAATMAAEVLHRTKGRVREKEADRDLANFAMRLAREAVAADRFTEAASLAEAARDLARKTRETEPIQEAVSLMREVETRRQLFADYRAALAVLARGPDDPAANLVVGRYYCFTKHEWKQGLPHLVRGNDPVLGDLARTEEAMAAGAPDAFEQVALGDRWWDAGASAGEAQRAYRHRAAYWYKAALPGLSGLTETRVRNRLEQLGQN